MPTPSSSEPNHRLERRLSIEQTYSLADTARRKSLLEATRNDLRLLVGHSNVLELLLNEIAKSAPPSPTGVSPKSDTGRQHIAWSPLEVAKVIRYVETEPEYECDDGEEDLASLSLVRTPSRQPQR
jgi:hypothetical protein